MALWLDKLEPQTTRHIFIFKMRCCSVLLPFKPLSIPAASDQLVNSISVPHYRHVSEQIKKPIISRFSVRIVSNDSMITKFKSKKERFSILTQIKTRRCCFGSSIITIISILKTTIDFKLIVYMQRFVSVTVLHILMCFYLFAWGTLQAAPLSMLPRNLTGNMMLSQQIRILSQKRRIRGREEVTAGWRIVSRFASTCCLKRAAGASITTTRRCWHFFMWPTIWISGLLCEFKVASAEQSFSNLELIQSYLCSSVGH